MAQDEQPIVLLININNISIELTSPGKNVTFKNVDFEKKQNTENIAMELPNIDTEENDDPLKKCKQATSETCLQSVLPNYPVSLEENNENNSLGNEVCNIAPGEIKHPISIMMDKICEELAFPLLYANRRFGHTEERKIEVIPVKYFNARLLHYRGKFATIQDIFSLHSL